MGTSVRERSDNPLSVFADKIPHGDGNRAHTMVRSPSVRTPQASARAATILSPIVGTVFFDSASGRDLGGAFGVAAWIVVALGLLAALAGLLLPRARPAATAPSATV